MQYNAKLKLENIKTENALTVIVHKRAAISGQQILEFDLFFIELRIVGEEDVLEKIVLTFASWWRLHWL